MPKKPSFEKVYIGTQPEPKDRTIIKLSPAEAAKLPKRGIPGKATVTDIHGVTYHVRSASCGVPGCLCALEFAPLKLTIREVRLHVGGYGVLLETADPQHPERPLIVGSCEGRDFTDAEHKAHADQIVEAVNRHDALLSTLRTLVESYDAIQGTELATPAVQELVNYINVQCRAVLDPAVT